MSRLPGEARYATLLATRLLKLIFKSVGVQMRVLCVLMRTQAFQI